MGQGWGVNEGAFGAGLGSTGGVNGAGGCGAELGSEWAGGFVGQGYGGAVGQGCGVNGLGRLWGRAGGALGGRVG